MDIEEAKEQLRSLQNHCKTMGDDIFKKDAEAIEIIFAELERKNRIIDKMALKITKLDNSNEYCSGRKKICPYDNPTLKKCKECIKKYYEKRNKNDYCKSKQTKCN